jgi:hypothetical protein
MTWPVFSDVTFSANNASVVINNSAPTTGILAGFALHHGSAIYEIIAVGAGTFTLAGDNLPPATASNVSVKIQPTAAPFENLLQSALTKANENGDNFLEIINNLRTIATSTGTVPIIDAGGVTHNVQGFGLLGDAAQRNVQTSPTDTTAGALMVVGASGLVLDSNTTYLVDFLDTNNTSGFGAYTSVTLNKPPNSNFGEYIYLPRDKAAGQRGMIAISADNANDGGGIYYRALNDGGSLDTTWQHVYTGANLNPNVFGGMAGFKAATGYARSATTLRVDLDHSVEGVAQSLIKGVGDFNVTDTFFNILFVVTPANITVATKNQKLMTINVSGVSGLVADRPYFLTSVSIDSTLEVSP